MNWNGLGKPLSDQIAQKAPIHQNYDNEWDREHASTWRQDGWLWLWKSDHMNASTVTSHGRLLSLQIRNGSYVIRRWLQTGKKNITSLSTGMEFQEKDKAYNWSSLKGHTRQASKRKSNPLSSFSVKVNAQGREAFRSLFWHTQRTYL